MKISIGSIKLKNITLDTAATEKTPSHAEGFPQKLMEQLLNSIAAPCPDDPDLSIEEKYTMLYGPDQRKWPHDDEPEPEVRVTVTPVNPPTPVNVTDPVSTKVTALDDAGAGEAASATDPVVTKFTALDDAGTGEAAIPEDVVDQLRAGIEAAGITLGPDTTITITRVDAPSTVEGTRVTTTLVSDTTEGDCEDEGDDDEEFEEVPDEKNTCGADGGAVGEGSGESAEECGQSLQQGPRENSPVTAAVTPVQGEPSDIQVGGTKRLLPEDTTITSTPDNDGPLRIVEVETLVEPLSPAQTPTSEGVTVTRVESPGTEEAPSDDAGTPASITVRVTPV